MRKQFLDTSFCTLVKGRGICACVLFALCSLLLAPCPAVEAQQLAKMPKIGFLNALFPTTNPARIEAFRQGLRDIGYVEGKNIVIEYRYAERKFDRLPPLPVRWCVSK